MRIFKNRGDIYFSKSNKEKSREQRFLFTALIGVIVFTVVFMSAVGIKYNFSAKEFFAPDEEITTAPVSQDSELILPEVSGKTNFLLCVNKDEQLLFASLIQSDLDNISYKTTILKPDTECDGESLNEIYKMSGIQSVQGAVELMFGTSIDFYIDINQKSFEDIFNKASTVSVPILNDIKYKSEDDEKPSYGIRIKSGEQKLNGGDFIDLIRYYMHNDMCAEAGEVMLAALHQIISPEFLENKEELFTELVTKANTNLTVRDFSLAETAFDVLTNEKVGVGGYNAYAEYDGNKISENSLQNIKGYFSK